MDKPQVKPDKKMEYRGVNHVALVARDMAETVEFYTQVLGMKLIKTLNMNGHGQHFFFDSGNGGTIAFFWFPDAPKVAPGIASSHRDKAKHGIVTAHGSMNHLAVSIPLEKFDEYVEKLRDKSVEVSVTNHNDDSWGTPEPIASTWVRSMYFFDPNGVRMEFAAYTRPFTKADVKHLPRNAKGEYVPYRNKELPTIGA